MLYQDCQPISTTIQSLLFQVFWNLAVVRGVYGVFCTVVGSWAIFCHTGLEKDAVFATTPTSHLAMCVSVGFFVFECTAVTLSDVFFGNFSALLHVHHWLSLIGFIIGELTFCLFTWIRAWVGMYRQKPFLFKIKIKYKDCQIWPQFQIYATRNKQCYFILKFRTST